MTVPDLAVGPGPCYRHPERITGVRCTRCNRPICPDCMRSASVGFQCPDDARTGRITQRTAVGGRVRATDGVVTMTLIGVNVLIYLITALTPGGTLDDPGGSRLFTDLELATPLAAGTPPYATQPELYRLITYAFLHANLLTSRRTWSPCS